MLQDFLKGRFLGHPVHPMLVHFPTALFSAGFLFDIAGILLEESSLFTASFYVLVLGLAFGLLAGVFGMIDYVSLGSRPELFETASWHAGIQFVVLAAFGVVAGFKFQAYPDVASPSVLELTAMGGTLAAMLIGNYLGGELVFTYKVGIDEDT